MPLRHTYNHRRAAPGRAIDMEIKIPMLTKAGHERHRQAEIKYLRRMCSSDGTFS